MLQGVLRNSNKVLTRSREQRGCAMIWGIEVRVTALAFLMEERAQARQALVPWASLIIIKCAVTNIRDAEAIATARYLARGVGNGYSGTGGEREAAKQAFLATHRFSPRRQPRCISRPASQSRSSALLVGCQSSSRRRCCEGAACIECQAFAPTTASG